jgi:hypothetical protein
MTDVRSPARSLISESPEEEKDGVTTKALGVVE